MEEASQALEDSGGDDLVREYETELEQIDQQLLVLIQQVILINRTPAEYLYKGYLLIGLGLFISLL